MKRFLLATFSLAAISLTGCHKIYYHNAGQIAAVKNAAQYNDWHHIGVLGLVEFSEPINIKAKCEKGWNAIETENSFLSGLVSAVTYSLYTPREANLVCK